MARAAGSNKEEGAAAVRVYELLAGVKFANDGHQVPPQTVRIR